MKNEIKPDMAQEKARRVAIVNEVIKEIAGRGRNFLSHNGVKDFIYLRKGKIFYLSAYLDSKGQNASVCLSVTERARPLIDVDRRHNTSIGKRLLRIY